MSLNLEAKKTLLRKIPHGLFVCGVRDGDEINGFTVSWVTQGSFEPPLVVIGVRSDSSSNLMIKNSNYFSLNFLCEDQKEIAAKFFKPQKALGKRFDEAPFIIGKLGLPLLTNAMGGIECELVGNITHGDHTVYVGEVKTAQINKDGELLTMKSTGWNYGG